MSIKVSGLALLLVGSTLIGADLKSAIELPDAKAILKKDIEQTGEPQKYKMPKDCITTEKEALDEGKIFFNNINNGSGKFAQYDKEKNFGNCVACHNIKGADGYGNLGPDLTKYHENFIKSGARDVEWVYQKIADPRIDNKNTVMTVNLTTKLMSERELCNVLSFILSDK